MTVGTETDISIATFVAASDIWYRDTHQHSYVCGLIYEIIFLIGPVISTVLPIFGVSTDKLNVGRNSKKIKIYPKIRNDNLSHIRQSAYSRNKIAAFLRAVTNSLFVC